MSVQARAEKPVIEDGINWSGLVEFLEDTLGDQWDWEAFAEYCGGEYSAQNTLRGLKDKAGIV